MTATLSNTRNSRDLARAGRTVGSALVIPGINPVLSQPRHRDDALTSAGQVAGIVGAP